MAPGLSSIVVLALYVVLSPCVSAGDDCLAYSGHSYQECKGAEFCCGDCSSRYCCSDFIMRFEEDSQEGCLSNAEGSFNIPDITHTILPTVIGGVSLITIALIIICCCVCPCCCLYKMCHKPRPVIATTVHSTVVSTTPQHYPQQPTAVPGPAQSYQGAPYQPVLVQPGYGAQPGYPAQPMPISPYHGQPFTPGPPPPSYQEATGPAYPPQPMPYSQAAFTPDQLAYPLKPLAQPMPNAPPASTDFVAQPAYNPDFVPPPP